MKKDEQLVKKISLVVLSIILIGLITLTIFYFANSQIKYIYQRDRSIEIDSKVFATLSTPTAITTDSEGNVYVLDGENDKVKKFTIDGSFVKEWSIQRSKASQLIPIDITTDSAGNVYVLNGGSNIVQKYTTDGIFVKEWKIN